MKLGQHFLKSKSIIDKIIEVAGLEKNDVVLEIGPGGGTLTEALIENSNAVIAVEKDGELFEFLKQKFENKKNLHLVHNDILKIENSKLIENCKLKIENFKVVANIPYYITGAILKKFLSGDCQPSTMVLMVQKEVAQRIVTKPPQMSILALSVQIYGNPKIVARVPKGHFSPPPKVDSAIIKISDISKKFFTAGVSIDEKKFFALVNQGFSHKRKMLKNNLQVSGEVLKKAGLSEKARAQELSLDDWKKLYHLLN